MSLQRNPMPRRGSDHGESEDGGGTVQIVYILYLVAIAVGLTALVGVVMAYVNRTDAPEWLQDHYRYQIRTFWIGLLYSAIGVLTSVIAIGWIVMFVTLIWWIVRCAKGLKQLGRGEPIPNVATWGW
jgi:uncharacterized membrane protein